MGFTLDDDGIDWVDWNELYARLDGDEAIIPGIAYRGRWTAIASPAKAGKSTILLGLAVKAATEGVIVLYLDAEMGRGDILDRVEDWMHLKPADLANMRYTDLPPKMDTVEGANLLVKDAEAMKADLVVIDGLNGVVNGAENEDTTWRDLYEWAIAPLKTLNVAVVSADNLGKDKTQGPRGSSVKLDKADAVLRLERTDDGVKLEATHRRSASYPLEQHYTVRHADDSNKPMTVTVVGGSSPAGTAAIVTLLDKLDAPNDIGIRAARRLIRENGGEGRNEAIDAAVRLRRNSVPEFSGTFGKPLLADRAPSGCPEGAPAGSEEPGEQASEAYEDPFE